MNKEYFVNHPQDKKDAFDAIDAPYPYKIIVQRLPVTPIHADEYEKRRKLMAYFHRSIVPEFSKAAGVSEVEAKAELQMKFCRVGEILVDETGEFDVMWIDTDRYFIAEQGKHYWVESIAGMSNDRLSEVVNNVKDYILQQYGVFVKDYINTKTKKI